MADYDWPTGDSILLWTGPSYYEWTSLVKRVAQLEQEVDDINEPRQEPVSDPRDELKSNLRWEESLTGPANSTMKIHYRNGRYWNEWDQELNTGDLIRAGWIKKGRWVSDWMDL